MTFLASQSSAAATVDTRRLVVGNAVRAGTLVARESEPHGRVLILEDDEYLRLSLKLALRACGYDVVGTGDLSETRNQIRVARPDLLLLDRMVPDGDALDLVRQLRADLDTIPVVIVTARDSLNDRIDGFDHGVDDYIVKPFHIDELVARVSRALRRSGPDRQIEQTYADDLVRLDFRTGEVQIGGATISLSQSEFRCFDVLVRNAGAVQSREMIAVSLWGTDQRHPNALDAVVMQLRRKLKATALGDGAIMSVRGRGYLYQAPATSTSQESQPTSQRLGYGHASQVLDIVNARDRQKHVEADQTHHPAPTTARSP